MDGVQPSYVRIAERMNRDPGYYIEEQRLPAGIMVLRDMKLWLRAELDAWMKHILAGQNGSIPSSRRLAWRITPRPAGEPDVPAPAIDLSTAPMGTVRWTAEELLYQEHQKLKEDQPEKPSWKGLPLARTTYVYVPYSVDLFHALEQMHDSTRGMQDLLTEIARMEELGPIHVSGSHREEYTLTSCSVQGDFPMIQTSRIHMFQAQRSNRSHVVYSLLSGYLWHSLIQ